MSGIFGFIENYKGAMVGSISLAVLSVGCGMIPYFAVSRIIILFLQNEADMGRVVMLASLSLAGYALHRLPFALQGSMTVPVLFMLLIASFTIFSSIESMGGVTVQVRMMDASLDRIEAIKNVEIIDENGRDIQLTRYDIELNHATFSYGQRQVIRDVSFTIP